MPTWDEFWGSLDFLPVVGWVLGIAGILAFAVKSWPRVRQFVGFVDALFSLPAFIARTDATLEAQNEKIDGIHHETHHNNGSSLKDSQRRTELAADRIELGVAGLYKVLGKVVADNPALAAELATELEHTRPRRTRKPKE